MTTSGAPITVTLDGIHLANVSPEAVDITPRELVTHREAAAGTSRESRPWIDAGSPAKTIKRTFAIDYAHLRDGAGSLVDRLLATSGEHRLALWKHVEIAFHGNGAQAELTCPWPLVRDALDAAGAPITTPGGHPWSRFATAVRLGGPLAAPVEPVVVDAATYDGDPATGVVWRLEGTPNLKLAPADVPAAGAAIYVSAVPEFRVLVVSSRPGPYRGPIREPRRLELREA